RKRKIPITTLIRAIDRPGLLPEDKDNPRFAKYFNATEDKAREQALRELEREHLGSDERLIKMFADVDTSDIHQFLPTTISKEPREPLVKDMHDALLEFYRKIRPGDPPTHDNARNLLKTLFFEPRRYDLG